MNKRQINKDEYVSEVINMGKLMVQLDDLKIQAAKVLNENPEENIQYYVDTAYEYESLMNKLYVTFENLNPPKGFENAKKILLQSLEYRVKANGCSFKSIVAVAENKKIEANALEIESEEYYKKSVRAFKRGTKEVTRVAKLKK